MVGSIIQGLGAGLLQPYLQSSMKIMTMFAFFFCFRRTVLFSRGKN